MKKIAALGALTAVMLSATMAPAATMFLSNLVPVSTSNPTMSKLSKIKLLDTGLGVVPLKGVTDGTGAFVTTDPLNPHDNYFVVVTAKIGALPASAVNISADVKKGNGTVKPNFSALLALAAPLPAPHSLQILGVEVHGPAVDDAGCQAVMTNPTFPGIYIPGINPPTGPNPCASGTLLGVDGLALP